MTDEEARPPEWCIVGTLLPYPYKPNGPYADMRSQKIFLAGARLHVIGGFAGPGYETVTVVGYAHRRRNPVVAHLKAHYIGGWHAKLVYRPAILRAIDEAGCDRWLSEFRPEVGYVEHEPTTAEYGAYLARVAASFQRSLHGEPLA